MITRFALSRPTCSVSRAMGLALCVALVASATSLFPHTAMAQNQEFMSGRLFQVALESAPGFERRGSPAFGTLATGEARQFEQEVASGHCYTWIAVGETGTTDLDLAVFSAGEQVAMDTSLDDWPVVQHCATVDGSIRVDVTMYTGSGHFGFATYARFYGGSDQVEVYMNFLAGMYTPNGTPTGPIQRARLESTGERRFPLSLDGGACYTIIGTSGAGVRDIDFFLENQAGQVVSADEAPDNYPLVGACPPEAGNYQLRVRMYDGSGEFGFQIFREQTM